MFNLQSLLWCCLKVGVVVVWVDWLSQAGLWICAWVRCGTWSPPSAFVWCGIDRFHVPPSRRWRCAGAHLKVSTIRSAARVTIRFLSAADCASAWLWGTPKLISTWSVTLQTVNTIHSPLYSFKATLSKAFAVAYRMKPKFRAKSLDFCLYSNFIVLLDCARIPPTAS